MGKQIKFCPCCEKDKSVDDFYDDKYRKDGKRVYCKVCAEEKVREYESRNKKKAIAWANKSVRAFYRRNREESIAKSKKYREEHLESIRKYDREYKRKIRARKAKQTS